MEAPVELMGNKSVADLGSCESECRDPPPALFGPSSSSAGCSVDMDSTLQYFPPKAFPITAWPPTEETTETTLQSLTWMMMSRELEGLFSEEEARGHAKRILDECLAKANARFKEEPGDGTASLSIYVSGSCSMVSEFVRTLPRPPAKHRRGSGLSADTMFDIFGRQRPTSELLDMVRKHMGSGVFSMFPRLHPEYFTAIPAGTIFEHSGSKRALTEEAVKGKELHGPLTQPGNPCKRMRFSNAASFHVGDVNVAEPFPNKSEISGDFFDDGAGRALSVFNLENEGAVANGNALITGKAATALDEFFAEMKPLPKLTADENEFKDRGATIAKTLEVKHWDLEGDGVSTNMLQGAGSQRFVQSIRNRLGFVLQNISGNFIPDDGVYELEKILDMLNSLDEKEPEVQG
ncbi:hypothetical protein BS78_09G039300 [Paspalum vaginatum]|nr:hypothetical protein BS78_09G039300 [Paspalum vaginatum]